MPGYGESTGKRQKSKSSNVFDKDGPADYIKFVIKKLQLDNKNIKLCIGGYDWGAAIALKMCLKNTMKFKKIIALLPSYNEDTKGELKSIQVPTLI